MATQSPRPRVARRTPHVSGIVFGIGTATLALLLIRIHNAWDTITYVILDRVPRDASKKELRKGSPMDIKKSGSQPSGKGPAECFTGTVRIDPLFQPPEPARALGVSVTF